ncbi:phage terminase small subunit P27 family [Kineococcus sp. TBRC 1896]|uniref:Phage terminase small subunit P27 family n=1 Tax=Kineococcus mangrovi TaxID=1660183 RepID=A0ABV4HWJ6_9ACTN
MPGRLPLEQKRARGRRPGTDSGGRRLPAQGDLVALPGAEGVPAVPQQLLDAGRARWRQVWGHASWLSPAADVPTVTRLCELEDLVEALRSQLAGDGAMVTGSTGQLRMHPAWAEIRAVLDRLLKLESALGLTPAARSALGVAEVQRAQEVSPLEAILTEHRARQDGGGAPGA